MSRSAAAYQKLSPLHPASIEAASSAGIIRANFFISVIQSELNARVEPVHELPCDTR